LTRFFTTLAAVAMLGTCGFAQASSQADGPPFEIKPHHTGISVPNLEDRDLFFVRDNSGNAFELIQYKQ